MNFKYVARNKTGERVEGTVEANDKTGAMLAIEKLGYTPICINPAALQTAAAASPHAQQPARFSQPALPRRGPRRTWVWVLGCCTLVVMLAIPLAWKVLSVGDVESSIPKDGAQTQSHDALSGFGKQEVISYLRDHPGTDLDQKIGNMLAPFGKPSNSYVAKGQFAILARNSRYSSSATFSMRQVDRNFFEALGVRKELPTTTPRDEGGVVDNNWGIGAQQTILGSLVHFDYCFVSDCSDPLSFCMARDGYTYRSGSGAVVDPQGEIVLLGRGFGIHSAVLSGDVEILKKRLKSDPGAVRAFDKNGFAALHAAASVGTPQIVNILLAHGADVNIKDAAGGTPLHKAAFYGQKEIAALLLKKKASIGAVDKSGQTPLHKAAFRGHKEIVLLLLDHNAEVNAGNNTAGTALHAAAFSGFKDVVDVLLAQKADVNAKMQDGATPLRLALSKGNQDVVALLRQHGGIE